MRESTRSPRGSLTAKVFLALALALALLPLYASAASSAVSFELLGRPAALLQTEDCLLTVSSTSALHAGADAAASLQCVDPLSGALKWRTPLSLPRPLSTPSHNSEAAQEAVLLTDEGESTAFLVTQHNALSQAVERTQAVTLSAVRLTDGALLFHTRTHTQHNASAQQQPQQTLSAHYRGGALDVLTQDAHFRFSAKTDGQREETLVFALAGDSSLSAVVSVLSESGEAWSVLCGRDSVCVSVQSVLSHNADSTLTHTRTEREIPSDWLALTESTATDAHTQRTHTVVPVFTHTHALSAHTLIRTHTDTHTQSLTLSLSLLSHTGEVSQHTTQPYTLPACESAASCGVWRVVSVESVQPAVLYVRVVREREELLLAVSLTHTHALTASVTESARCVDCALRLAAQRSHTHTHRHTHTQSSVIRLPSSHNAPTQLSVRAHKTETVCVAVTERDEILAFSLPHSTHTDAQAQLLWGRDESLSLTQHVFALSPTQRTHTSSDSEEDVPKETQPVTRSLLETLSQSLSLSRAQNAPTQAFLTVQHAFSDEELSQRPEAFSSLRLSLARLSLTAQRALSVRTTHLSLPAHMSERDARVRAVRVVVAPPHAHTHAHTPTHAQAIVAVQTESDVCVWSVDADTLTHTHSEREFSVPHMRFHTTRSLSASLCVSVSVSARLRSVAPVLSHGEELVGIRLVLSDGVESPVRVLSLTLKGAQVDRTTHHFLTYTDRETNALLIHKTTTQSCEAALSHTQSHSPSQWESVCVWAAQTSSVRFDERESVVSVAHAQSEDIVHSRTVPVGDGNVLVKYLNPHLLVVCTAVRSEEMLYVHAVDSVSGKVLLRVPLSHAHTGSASLSETQAQRESVQALVMENFVFVSYWNNKAKRNELFSLSLYEALIGKHEYTPWASARTQSALTQSLAAPTHSAFSQGVPLAVHKVFSLASSPSLGRVVSLAHTQTRRGVAHKHLVVAGSNGVLFAVDVRALNPRRPVDEPTPAEKEEGLVRYSPLLPLSPLQALARPAVTHTHARVSVAVSASAELESRCAVLSLADAHTLAWTQAHTPSGAFDSLSEDFSHSLLLALLALLCGCVVVLRETQRRSALSRLWL